MPYVTIRCEAELKEKAAAVAASYGFDLSTVIRLFLTQVVQTNTIPVSLDYAARAEQDGKQAS